MKRGSSPAVEELLKTAAKIPRNPAWMIGKDFTLPAAQPRGNLQLHQGPAMVEVLTAAKKAAYEAEQARQMAWLAQHSLPIHDVPVAELPPELKRLFKGDPRLDG